MSLNGDRSFERVSNFVCQLAAAALFSLLAVATASASDCQGDPWLELEVFAGQIAGERLVESTKIDTGGCVATLYAEFDIRGGHYQRSLAEVDRQDLMNHLSSSRLLAFDAEAEQRAMADRLRSLDGHVELFYIADADLHRLTIHDGKLSKVIEWKSPELVANQRNASVGLQELAHFISQIKRAGADPRRADVREMSP